MEYTLLPGGHILREDGATIPPDPNNRDYAEYLVWAETHTPTPAPVLTTTTLSVDDNTFGGNPWLF